MCSPAVRPVLVQVLPDELVNVSDETYEKLITNEKRLQNWGVANEKILLEVCEK